MRPRPRPRPRQALLLAAVVAACALLGGARGADHRAGEAQSPVLPDDSMAPFFGDPAAPRPRFVTHEASLERAWRQSDASEGNPQSSCAACMRIVQKVAEEAVELKLQSDELVVKTQVACTRGALGPLLRIECSQYHDVRDFLIRGGMISSEPVALGTFATNSAAQRQFCDQVDLCGNVNYTRIHEIERVLRSRAQADPFGAVVVRFMLKPPYSTLSRPSEKWTAFRTAFIAAVAPVLGVEPDRLELRMEAGDELAEMVVRAGGSRVGPTPFSVARTFRAYFSRTSTATVVPPVLRQQVDLQFRPQIVPLVIPSTINKVEPEPRPSRNYTGPSCRVLLYRATKSCGSSWQCAAGCKRDYKEYFSRCLANSLSPEEHGQVFAQFTEFFRICEECTEKRNREVVRRCGMNSTRSNFPPKCTLYCSNAFVPLYKDCLTVQSVDFSEKERREIDAFYGECSKCTPSRVSAVRAICDTRQGSPPNNTFPQTCLRNCSSVYVPFYDACLEGTVDGVMRAATDFRRRCEDAANGGVSFRIKLGGVAMTSIESTDAFQAIVLKELGGVLEVNATRFAVTLIKSADAHQGSVFVDVHVKIGDSVLESDPRAIIDDLRHLISMPMSPLFALPTLRKIDSLYGARTLIPGTHDEDQQQPSSSLLFSREKLRGAIESGAPFEFINVLRALVTYHTHVAQDATAEQLKEDLAYLEYMQSIFKKNPAERIRARFADYQFAAMRNSGASAASLGVYQGIAVYMRDIADGASAETLLRDRAFINYMEGIEGGSSRDKLNELNAVYQYLRDVAAGASEQQLGLDRALINYFRGVLKPLGSAQLATLAAIVDYMQAVAARAPQPEITAREATVEYLNAVSSGAPNYEVAERHAIMEYQRAVYNNAPRAVLESLAALVLRLHNVAVEAKYHLERAKQ